MSVVRTAEESEITLRNQITETRGEAAGMEQLYRRACDKTTM